MLRITSGELRNRRIPVPSTGDVRPMLEKPREALFSILGQDIAAGRVVIDAFAGTGVLGLECVSRGASHALFFDTNRKHIAALEKLVETFRVQERCTIRRGNVMRSLGPSAFLRLPGGEPAKLIFLDPPHAMSNEAADGFYPWFAELADAPCTGEDTIAIIGHHARAPVSAEAGRWQRFDLREYGSVALSLYGRDGYQPGNPDPREVMDHPDMQPQDDQPDG